MKVKDFLAGQAFEVYGNKYIMTATKSPSGSHVVLEEDNGVFETVYMDGEAEALGLDVPATAPEEKPCYFERQKKWAEENNVKAGSVVLVTRAAESQEDGWPVGWPDTMNKLVGKVQKVVDLDSRGVQVEDLDALFGVWNVPFFVCQAVAKKDLDIDPGQGCRLLRLHETTKIGDEFTSDLEGGWVTPAAVGHTVRTHFELEATLAVRRLAEPAGEGYRLLGWTEKAEHGDEYYSSSEKRWEECCTGIGHSPKYYCSGAVRRKLPAEPKLRPFTFEELINVVGETLVPVDDIDVALVIEGAGKDPTGKAGVRLGGQSISAKTASEIFTFIGGAPFGVLE